MVTGIRSSQERFTGFLLYAEHTEVTEISVKMEKVHPIRTIYIQKIWRADPEKAMVPRNWSIQGGGFS